MTRSINAAGEALIKQLEMLRLEAYRDAAGVWTIGWGSTRGVHAGMTTTQAQAEERFLADLAPAETAVSSLVKVVLGDNQYAALVSFTFNLGSGALKTSTLLKKLNAGDYAAVPDEMRRFVMAAGHKLQGLVNRREAEIKLWLTPDTPAARVPAAKPATHAAVAKAPSSAATTKAPSMTTAPAASAAKSASIVTEAETAGVNVLSGIGNLFGFLKTGVTSGAKVATSGGAAASALGGIVGNVENLVTGDGGAFETAITTFISDVEAKKWGSAPHDVEACLKTGFAILTKFGVSIPVASAVVAALPDVPAV